MQESINKNLCEHVDFQALLDELLKLRNKSNITATGMFLGMHVLPSNTIAIKKIFVHL